MWFFEFFLLMKIVRFSQNRFKPLGKKGFDDDENRKNKKVSKNVK